MDLCPVALCLVLTAVHQAMALDRQYCAAHCPLPGPALGELPESAGRGPAALELSGPLTAAAPAVGQLESGPAGAPATPGQPEAVLVATKRGQTAQYTHYPSRFQSEQYKVCKPTSGQIVKFLQALHAARKGEPNQLATLCDTTRSVAGIQTNMRFIG